MVLLYKYIKWQVNIGISEKKILSFMDREGDVDYVLERRHTMDGLVYMVKLIG